jgi:serine/threonine protein kinase
MNAQLLGEGAYGKVYKVHPNANSLLKDPKQAYAIKIIETFK